MYRPDFLRRVLRPAALTVLLLPATLLFLSDAPVSFSQSATVLNF